MPCLLFDGSGLIKTVKFKNPSYIGDPINAVKIFNEKEVDELILIDVNASKEKRRPKFDKIADIAGEAFMPFAYGGGVKTYQDFSTLFKIGVEKVIVNSLIQENPDVVRGAVAAFGSQAVVGCIDYKKALFGNKIPFSHLGRRIGMSLLDYVKYLEQELGVGELMLYSVDRDGTWEGYDLETIAAIASNVSIPIIACGGCGNTKHLSDVLYQAGANAAALGSMAVYSEKGMGVLISFPERKTVVHE